MSGDHGDFAKVRESIQKKLHAEFYAAPVSALPKKMETKLPNLQNANKIDWDDWKKWEWMEPGWKGIKMHSQCVINADSSAEVRSTWGGRRVQQVPRSEDGLEKPTPLENPPHAPPVAPHTMLYRCTLYPSSSNKDGNKPDFCDDKYKLVLQKKLKYVVFKYQKERGLGLACEGGADSTWSDFVATLEHCGKDHPRYAFVNADDGGDVKPIFVYWSPNDSDPPLEEEVRKKFGIAEGKTVQAKDAGDLDFKKIQGLVKGFEVGPSAGELSGGSFLGRSGAAGIAHNGLLVGLFGFAVVSAFSGLLCRRRRQGPVQPLNQDPGSDDDSETSTEGAAEEASAPKIVWK